MCVRYCFMSNASLFQFLGIPCPHAVVLFRYEEESGIRMEPFNTDMDRETGHFEGGHFIEDKFKMSQRDAWLDEVTSSRLRYALAVLSQALTWLMPPQVADKYAHGKKEKVSRALCLRARYAISGPDRAPRCRSEKETRTKQWRRMWIRRSASRPLCRRILSAMVSNADTGRPTELAQVPRRAAQARGERCRSSQVAS